MSKEPLASNAMVRVARIGKPHGIRGEVTVEVFTDSPEMRFSEGNVLEVRASAGPTIFEELTVEKARWNKRILLLKFSEFSDRNTAEAVRNHELYATVEPRADGEESWYAADLIGFEVYLDSFGSEAIGTVSDLITGKAQDLLEVRLFAERVVLIPFVEEIVPEISEELRSLVVMPPSGLLELNQD
jgi:16S rRNA processing protein RimM